MDIIFIDTSVFISENFLEGKKIKEIYKLAKDGHLKIIMPKITFKELINKINENGKEALDNYKSFRNKTRILKNLPDFKEKFSDLDEEQTIRSLSTLFTEKLKSLNTIFLDYPTLNIGNIFDKYFNREYPFAGSNKKHEFPDAFTIASLEEWCKQKKTKCIIISGDSDFLKYKNKNLVISKSLESYLDTILRKVELTTRKTERIEIAMKLFEENKHKLETEITEWLTDQLTDPGIYSDFDYDNIEDIAINENWTSLNDDPHITSVTEYSIIIDSYALLNISIELETTTTEESSYWIHDKPETEIERRFKIPVSFEVEIPIAGDRYMDIKVDEINNGRDLEL